MVGARRFELRTSTTPLWRATKLRYAPTVLRGSAPQGGVMIPDYEPAQYPPEGREGGYRLSSLRISSSSVRT